MFTNLQMPKLAIAFHKNTMSLYKLLGYVESTYSNKIWPQHPSSIKEKKCLRISFNLDISHFTAANTTGSGNHGIPNL